jgi:hypothetical protein
MSRRINIVTVDNGFGLSRDRDVVRDLLVGAGYEVACTSIGSGYLPGRDFDINIFLEILDVRYFEFGRKQVLVPNPEWFYAEWIMDLARVDAVLCKTQDALRLFERMSQRAAYVGFTSRDRHDATVPRAREFLHVSGRSREKGSGAVVTVWRNNDDLELLHLVQELEIAEADLSRRNIRHYTTRVDEETLVRLQNRCVFHVVPSAYEGFGHAINEARSVGAVVITTGAAPMTELVDESTGFLASAPHTSRRLLAEMKHVSTTSLELAVRLARGTDEARIAAARERSRQRFLEEDRLFRARFLEAIAKV